jgi:hypothetical protein
LPAQIPAQPEPLNGRLAHSAWPYRATAPPTFRTQKSPDLIESPGFIPAAIHLMNALTALIPDEYANFSLFNVMPNCFFKLLTT